MVLHSSKKKYKLVLKEAATELLHCDLKLAQLLDASILKYKLFTDADPLLVLETAAAHDVEAFLLEDGSVVVSRFY